MQTERNVRPTFSMIRVVAAALFLIASTGVAAQTETTVEPLPPAPGQLAESGSERRARCENARQACVSQCAVLPQVRQCRQSCENQFQSCLRGQRRPILE